MSNIKPLFSQVASNNNRLSCASPSSQGIKRQRMNQNLYDNSVSKRTPNTQLRLNSFDSSDRQSQNKEINFNQDDGFTLAGNKKIMLEELTKPSNLTHKSIIIPFVC